jgi:hypothetical protein
MKWLSPAAILLGVHACSMPAGLTRLNNGDYKVQCSGHLLPCLQPAATACGEHGYDILSAEERRDLIGPSPFQTEVLKSVAVVRCHTPKPLFGSGPEPLPPPSASGLPPAGASSKDPRSVIAPAPAPRCVPGTSQACATPTCSGAQICAADGASFGPCECAPTVPPAADAGAP